MSHLLISHSLDLKSLREEGYDLRIVAGYLVVRDVPYVNSLREIKRGTLVMKLDLAGNITTQPADHVAYFSGEFPCRQDGTEISQIGNPAPAGSKTVLVPNLLEINHMFSAKPKPTDKYDNYYHKVTNYVAILSGFAREIDPTASARTYPVIETEKDESVFAYIDTASSRAEIDVATGKLALAKVAVIGLGGTGSYVLDLIAKTPVKEIHLFDRDVFSQHNAFRSPGAPSIEDLRGKPLKAAYLKGLYSKMHRGIVAHETYIDDTNVEVLRDMSFVFLCLDKGDVKSLIIAKLEENGIPFVDVGMGLYLSKEASIGGILRVTTSTPQQRDHIRNNHRISLADNEGPNEYARNIQVADLNALNAALAVIKWKKLFGFYLDLDREYHTTYTIDGNSLANEDKL